MTLSPSSWLQRLHSAFTASAQLLAPRSAACLLCGKTQSAARSAASHTHPQLPTQLRQSACGACLSAMPWLTRIYCSKCGRGISCDDCIRSPHHAFVYNRSAVQYNEAMRALLAQYKYRGNEQLGPVLGDMLIPAFEAMTYDIAQRCDKPADSRAGRGRAKQNTRYSDYWHAITYVPISRERAMDRGFNQAEQLASALASRYQLPLLHLLVRERHTEKQSFKTRLERLRDTRQLFNINAAELQKLHIHPASAPASASSENRMLRVLLIDDIYTTGSTAEACSQVLRQHRELPMEIYVLTWARS
ncbi:ComF family protein [Paenibacillus sp. sgz302251]|uniref:ComF family protein n=1 Tax=Paenibacillus sp. sgz302251 TaxID=3414493 RepID=UPI003C7BDCC3